MKLALAFDYDKRAKAVYWHGAEACRARGRHKAECLLEPGHDGLHIGSGFDLMGPIAGIVWGRPGTDDA